MPARLPLTSPPGVIDATEARLLAHTPIVPVASSKVMDEDWHNAEGPVMTGCGLTVTGWVTKHPVAVSWYFIVAVLGVELPVATPVIIPVPVAVAIVKGVLLHVPPGVASLSVVVLPAQIIGFPVIAEGNG